MAAQRNTQSISIELNWQDSNLDPCIVSMIIKGLDSTHLIFCSYSPGGHLFLEVDIMREYGPLKMDPKLGFWVDSKKPL